MSVLPAPPPARSSDGHLPRVLFVDDDPSVLDGLRRRLHGRFDITCADGGDAAIAAVQTRGPFAVVMSDMRMPGMNGAVLLERLRDMDRDMVRVLLTGFADTDSAIAAVNRGQIFRFLCKPCEPELLQRTLDDAVLQYRLVTAERELLEETLKGSVQALLETLSLAHPGAFARAVRIKDLVVRMIADQGRPDAWEIEVASMLSQLGAVTLPEPTIERLRSGEPLGRDEEEMVARLPKVADQLLAGIPRLEGARRIILEQQAPAGQHDVSFGGRVLRLAVAYEHLVASGAEPAVAIQTLRYRFEGDEALNLLSKLARSEASAQGAPVAIEVRVEDLVPGMVLETDVRTSGGALVVARGQVVTAGMAARLHNFGSRHRLTEMVVVTIQLDDDAEPALVDGV
jgi:response regulator RpfG family c-di-GMP phosphodiesterase